MIAGVSQSDDALRAEAADLIYHLLVLLESRGVAFDDVLAELESARVSGLAEKAARPQGADDEHKPFRLPASTAMSSPPS